MDARHELGADRTKVVAAQGPPPSLPLPLPPPPPSSSSLLPPPPFPPAHSLPGRDGRDGRDSRDARSTSTATSILAYIPVATLPTLPVKINTNSNNAVRPHSHSLAGREPPPPPHPPPPPSLLPPPHTHLDQEIIIQDAPDDDLYPDPDSDAETIVLPGKDGYSPTKARKVSHDDRGGGGGGDGRLHAASALAVRQQLQQGSDSTAPRRPPVKKKRPSENHNTMSAAASGGGTTTGSAARPPPAQAAAARPKDVSAGLGSALAPASPARKRRRSTDSDSEPTARFPNPALPRAQKPKPRSNPDRLPPQHPAKRRTPRAGSDDEDDPPPKARHQRTALAEVEPGMGLGSGRPVKDAKPRSHASSLATSPRVRSTSPSQRPLAQQQQHQHQHQHRRSISSQLPAQPSSTPGANGTGHKKKKLPPPLQPTDYQSDESSGSPHPRGAAMPRSSATAPAAPAAVVADSNVSPAKLAPHKKHLDAHGQTLLARACARGEYDLAKQRLDERPDDLNVADYAGNTPLQIAAINGHAAIVKLLVDAGCNLDCVNYDKDTPLLDAVDNGHLGVVQLLLAAGVNPRKTNVNGEEPIDRVSDQLENAAPIRAALAEARQRVTGVQRRPPEDSEPDLAGGRASHGPESPCHSPPPASAPAPPPAAITPSSSTGPLPFHLGTQSSSRRSGTMRSTKTSNHLLYMHMDNKTLRQAAGRGDQETVTRILNTRNGCDDPESMVAAARGGHDLVLQLLLALGGSNPDPEPVPSVPADFGTPILAAIGQENIKIITLLLGQTNFDPTKRFQGEAYFEIARRRQGPNWKEEERILREAYDKVEKKKKPKDVPVKTKSPNRRDREKEREERERDRARARETRDNRERDRDRDRDKVKMRVGDKVDDRDKVRDRNDDGRRPTRPEVRIDTVKAAAAAAVPALTPAPAPGPKRRLSSPTREGEPKKRPAAGSKTAAAAPVTASSPKERRANPNHLSAHHNSAHPASAQAYAQHEDSRSPLLPPAPASLPRKPPDARRDSDTRSPAIGAAAAAAAAASAPPAAPSERAISPAIAHRAPSAPQKLKKPDLDTAGASSEGDIPKPRRKLVSKGELRDGLIRSQARDQQRRASLASNASSLKEPSSPYESRQDEQVQQQQPADKQHRIAEPITEKYHDRAKALKQDDSRDRLTLSADGSAKRSRLSVTPPRTGLADKDDGGGEMPAKRRRIDPDAKERRLSQHTTSPEPKMRKTTSHPATKSSLPHHNHPQSHHRSSRDPQEVESAPAPAPPARSKFSGDPHRSDALWPQTTPSERERPSRLRSEEDPDVEILYTSTAKSAEFEQRRARQEREPEKRRIGDLDELRKKEEDRRAEEKRRRPAEDADPRRRLISEEDRRIEDDDRARKPEDEKRRKAEEEKRRKTDEEKKRRLEERKRRTEDERRRLAVEETEKQRKAEAEKQRRADEELQRRAAEQERRESEERSRKVEEEKKLEEDRRRKQEEEKEEEEKRRKEEEDMRLQEEEKKRKAEELHRRRAEEEKKRKEEEEKRWKEEEERKRQEEAEKRRKEEEEEQRLRQEIERKRQEAEAEERRRQEERQKEEEQEQKRRAERERETIREQERLRAEEERRRAEEARRIEEEARRVEAQRRKEEISRLEAQRKEEEARRLEVQRNEEEARRLDAQRKEDEARRLEARRKEEDARRLEAQRKEEAAKRLEARRKEEAAKRLEAQREEEEARRLEARRKEEEAKRLEAHRIEQEARRLEAQRIEQEARRLEAQRKEEEEATRLEAQRKKEEEARRLEAQRRKEEEASRLEAQRIEEARQLEAQRIEEEARQREAQRIEQEARLAESRRIEEEARLVEARRIEEEARLAEAQRIQEETRQLEARRIEEEARLVEAQRIQEEARQLEAQRRMEEERRRLEEEKRQLMLVEMLRREEEEKRQREQDEMRLRAEDEARIIREEEERLQSEEEERIRWEQHEREAAAEARRRIEEDKLQRQLAAQRELEHQQAARQAELQRIQEEMIRISNLPRLLQWLELCPNPKRTAYAALFRQMEGVRYDTIMPEVTGRDGSRDQWVLNTSVALFLGERDWTLPQFSNWKRIPASHTAKRIFMRLEADHYALTSSRTGPLARELHKYLAGDGTRDGTSDGTGDDTGGVTRGATGDVTGDVTGGVSGDKLSVLVKARVKRESIDKFMKLDLFFVRLADLLSMIPTLAHLRTVKLAIRYRELPEDETNVNSLSASTSKWKQDPDAGRYHGWAPGCKYFINGAIVAEDGPEFAPTSNTPFPDIRVPRRNMRAVGPDDPEYAKLCQEQGIDLLAGGSASVSPSSSLPNGRHSSPYAAAAATATPRQQPTLGPITNGIRPGHDEMHVMPHATVTTHGAAAATQIPQPPPLSAAERTTNGLNGAQWPAGS